MAAMPLQRLKQHFLEELTEDFVGHGDGHNPLRWALSSIENKTFLIDDDRAAIVEDPVFGRMEIQPFQRT
jgi:hypothetical protein